MFVIASIVLMTLDHRQQHVDTIRSTLSVLVYPIHWLVDLPANTTDWVQESIATRRSLQEENARLHEEQLLLKAELLKYQALQAENLRLRELLDSSFKVGQRVLISEIIGVDLDPYRHQILIDKGTRDEVFDGQPILDASGIMGQVIQTTPLNATAMLITDPSHAIPVQINRNGLRTVAQGIGSLEWLSLPHIPNSADIQQGDLLITSGLGGRFPPGYPVAIIERIQRDPGEAFAEVFARPLAALDRAREVLLVWSNGNALSLDEAEPDTSDTAPDGAGEEDNPS